MGNVPQGNKTVTFGVIFPRRQKSVCTKSSREHRTSKIHSNQQPVENYTKDISDQTSPMGLPTVTDCSVSLLSHPAAASHLWLTSI